MNDQTPSRQPQQYVAPFFATLPPNARLLVQAGVRDGELARAYRKIYPASSWLAVEGDAARAQQARDYAERVYQADLDTAGDAFYRQLEWADGWVFDATLENLHNPSQVLAKVREVIQFDACIVARVANNLHWNPPATPPRHPMALDATLALFGGAGFRVVSGILLNPSPLPVEVETALRLAAAASGAEPEPLLEAARPSHYLIKAVPA